MLDYQLRAVKLEELEPVQLIHRSQKAGEESAPTTPGGELAELSLFLLYKVLVFFEVRLDFTDCHDQKL